MSYKKIGMSLFILAALFFSTAVTTSVGFSQTPTYIDQTGDQGPMPAFGDIWKVWVDNNDTYIQFKLEIIGALNQSQWPVYLVYISINNDTGQNYGYYLPIDVQFQFDISPDGVVSLIFGDSVNISNTPGTSALPVGMGYYFFSNSNRTIELGYRFQTYYQGKGYFNVSIGQTIYLLFQGSWDPDYAPDQSLPMIRYVLEEETAGGIPGFDLWFLSYAVIVVATLYLIEKKRAMS